jgi:hypothetical protein
MDIAVRIFNTYSINFDAPDEHFDKSYLFNDVPAKNIENP